MQNQATFFQPERVALVADDDPHLRTMMGAMLRALGISVTELKDGWELLDTLHQIPAPALLVTDLQMPGYSGLRVIRYARRLALATPIILVTGFGNRRIHLEATRLGASGVLEKPFSIHALQALAARLLGLPAEPKPEPGDRMMDWKAVVLLVDDCGETRRMYAEALSVAFEVDQASTAREALQKASVLLPAVIVMDLGLPGMGGEDTISNLKRDARTRQIPVVVLSGRNEPRRRAAPWDAYLVKPCLPATLAACIDRVLGRAKPTFARH
jgi:CheY-like chemotaxis protein